MTFLELGPGTIPHPRTDIGFDLHHPVNFEPFDAADPSRPWPVPTASIDEVYSSHFMEHVAKGGPIIHVMSEVHRVLKPGGTFTIIHPLVGWTDEFGRGHQVEGWQPYADPTHVQFWWYPESLLYFCDGPFKPNADYGMPVFAPLGPQITGEYATSWLTQQRNGMIPTDSWWAVREGWEGVARVIRP